MCARRPRLGARALIYSVWRCVERVSSRVTLVFCVCTWLSFVRRVWESKLLNDVVNNTTSVCRWQVMNVCLYPRGLQLGRGGGRLPEAVRAESRQCLVRTAPRGTAGRATSQPTARGIRVVASVPGRGTVWQETPQWSDLETRVHAAFGAPIECALPHWPAGDYEAAVTAVQQWGRTAAALLVERGAATCARAVSGRKSARRRGRRRGARQ